LVGPKITWMIVKKSLMVKLYKKMMKLKEKKMREWKKKG
jgi:hypothetical protein